MRYYRRPRPVRHQVRNKRITLVHQQYSGRFSIAQIVPHPVLAQKFGELRETLNDYAVRTEAAELIDKLIESVTIYPDCARSPEAEVVAKGV